MPGDEQWHMTNNSWLYGLFALKPIQPKMGEYYGFDFGKLHATKFAILEGQHKLFALFTNLLFMNWMASVTLPIVSIGKTGPKIYKKILK